MILVIDNYDSFTFNLVHYLQELGAETHVVRNDEKSAARLLAMDIDGILVSPGPCTPDKAGVCLELIANLPTHIPLLGVCLGHQAIGQSFGGKIISAKTIMHGKTSKIQHQGQGLFAEIPDGFKATRYHSLAVDPQSLPACLLVDAHTKDGEIMALRHQHLPIYGVQFHPESIASEYGHKLLKNFLEICQGENKVA